MMAENLVESSNETLIYQLSSELSGLIIREHQILQDELNQVGALVEDAVKSLGTNIRELNKNVAEQAKIFAENSTDGKQDNGPISEITNQVSSNTSDMMRALQFDDIVQQLAGHASDRIAQMQVLFHVLDEMLSEFKSARTSDKKNQDNTHEQLQVMIESVIKYRLLLEKANPVKQVSMSAGRIELF